MKLSRTKQLEQKYNIKLKRENWDGWLVYFIYNSENDRMTCEWLLTLDDVENYINKNIEEFTEIRTETELAEKAKEKENEKMEEQNDRD